MIDSKRLSLFRALLEGARLGAQFPDASKWKALCDVLSRGGPRGKALHVTTSPRSGLISARSLMHLHRLQFVAREFFKTHRAKPSKGARAFSMALAAEELPPVAQTTARLISRTGEVLRLQIVHEQLASTAVRLTMVVEQRGRGLVSVGKDQLATPSEELKRALSLSHDTATTAWFSLSQPGVFEVIEVVRGELGPFLPLAKSDDRCARALSTLCANDEAGILSVTLQRLAADVAKSSCRDPWADQLNEPPGLKLAHERRLFVTSGLVDAVKALAGSKVLVRAI